METLIPFLKHSSTVDLLVILLVGLITEIGRASCRERVYVLV